MKKIFNWLIIFFLILISFSYAGRKSSDKVTDTNSDLNKYIQDVIGNKGDTTNYSIMGLLNTVTNSGASSDALLVITTNLITLSSNNEVTIEALQVITTNLATLSSNSEATAETLLIIITNDVRVIDEYHDVPGINSVSNNQMHDVIGNKSDTHSGTSLYSALKKVKDFFFINQDVYPTNAAPYQATNGPTAWDEGELITIVASNAIVPQFTITGISIETAISNDIYQLTLFYGPLTNYAGKVRFVKDAVTLAQVIPMSTILFNSNEIIQASLASAGGTSNHTVGLSLIYHTH